jgi:RNA polymerase sigma-70 factor (ECF subfamily)
MTGNAADADDLVQETFVRAIEKPPSDLGQPIRPWLVRVAINLCRDLLRRRKRKGYVGEWLPSPVRTAFEDDHPPSYEPIDSNDSPATRYEMIESLSFAFLLSLEALTPAQRAVLLLRDVFDYSTREAAEAIGITDASAKVLLHRARRRMQDYDRERAIPTIEHRTATRQALEKFLGFLAIGDTLGLERLLTENIVSISDGGGEAAAALRPIVGRDRVMRLILGLSRKGGGVIKTSFVELNGFPAIVVETELHRPGLASRFSIHVELDGDEQIRRLNVVVAPSKLTSLDSNFLALSHS